MARTKKEKPSMWERSNYEILSETVTETGTVAVLRNTYNGAIIECRVPEHTPEEEKRIAENAARAMMQIAYPGQDISRIKKMSIIVD